MGGRESEFNSGLFTEHDARAIVSRMVRVIVSWGDIVFCFIYLFDVLAGDREGRPYIAGGYTTRPYMVRMVLGVQWFILFPFIESFHSVM